MNKQKQTQIDRKIYRKIDSVYVYIVKDEILFGRFGQVITLKTKQIEKDINIKIDRNVDINSDRQKDRQLDRQCIFLKMKYCL